MSDVNKVTAKDDMSGMAEETIEAVIADSANSDAGKEKSSAASKPSKGGLFFIVLLLLTAAGVGALQLTGQLQPLYESAKAGVDQFQVESLQIESLQGDQPQATQLRDAQAPAKPLQTRRFSSSQKTAPTDITVPQDNALSKSAQMLTPSIPDVNSEEARILLSAMHQLRIEMQQLETSQRALQYGLIEQQKMNTQVRLRWIADPASRLPQMQLAWEEISLLPGLSDQQRQQAIAMHALARSNVQHVKQWQGELKKWADVLVIPIHRNVLPQPQQAWLAWIVSQFQLRQAPSQEARHLADLRSRLLNSARQLSLELWPNRAAWQRLHAELLLQIKAMQDNQHAPNEVAIETGLPADFSVIEQDISTLRQAARAWASDAQQGATL